MKRLKKMKDYEIQSVFGDEPMTLCVCNADGMVDGKPMAVAVSHWLTYRMVVKRDEFEEVRNGVGDGETLMVTHGEDWYFATPICMSDNFVGLELVRDVHSR